jgi:hypothetical protein
MRLKKFLAIFRLLFIIVGINFILLSIFAVQAGIDNDAGWGKGRILLLLLGVFLLIGALIAHFPSKFAALWQRLARSEPAQPIRVENPSRSLPLQRTLAAGLGVLICAILYTAIIHSQLTSSQTSNYYDQLADGFLAGHTWLPEKPPQALSDLANPYDWRNREGISYLWDATFYQGKYYLYWGAVPALIAAAIKLVHPMILLDKQLVLGFCIGINILFALLLCLMHKKLFANSPAWMLFPFTLLGGLAMPVVWLTIRPSVYEAAISGGQFFLLLGLYAALHALWKEGKSYGWLLLAGLAWGAAINCRINLAAAVGWFCLVFLVIYFKKHKCKAWLQHMLALALPLILWILALGAYNAVRYGSPLDTGHHYQLNGPGMPGNYAQVISLQYVLPSLYSYLIRPLQFNWSEFPYVFAPYISESMWPFFIHLPEYYYYPEPVAGILLSIPAVWLAFIPLLDLLRRLKIWLSEKTQTPALPLQQAQPIRQFWGLVGGAALLEFAVLLVFNATSMRYLADITPLLMLLSAAGFGWVNLRLAQAGKPKRWIILVACLLIFTGTSFSILAGLTQHG